MIFFHQMLMNPLHPWFPKQLMHWFHYRYENRLNSAMKDNQFHPTPISVIIPYIGAIIVTVPVLLVAFMQYGWSVDLAYIAVIYSVITVLAGYLLEPILFSEALNLHPIAIITAIMVFGGIWGFWGIFFAIPLATVVRAIINAWPREEANI